MLFIRLLQEQHVYVTISVFCTVGNNFAEVKLFLLVQVCRVFEKSQERKPVQRYVWQEKHVDKRGAICWMIK
jgi:hypothetical protein